MKKGISLIVLVITIIVMIILAASVVITLSNTDIINRASDAVDLTNMKNVEQILSLAWFDGFSEGKRDGELAGYVKDVAKDNGISEEKYNISVSNTGVNVKVKDGTFKSLINSAEDYGKTVNYTVTVNGIELNDWNLYYHTDEYIYLIASKQIPAAAIPSIVTTDKNTTSMVNGAALSGMGATIKTNSIYWYDSSHLPATPGIIQNRDLWLIGSTDYATYPNGRAASYFVDERYWSDFKNTDKYGDNVLATVGNSSLELFAASWNAKRAATKKYEKYNTELKVSYIPGEAGCRINDIVESVAIDKTDVLYFAGTTWDDCPIWFGTPCANTENTIFFLNRNGYIDRCNYTYYSIPSIIRPIICLKSSIKAHERTASDTATTDFVLEY